MRLTRRLFYRSGLRIGLICLLIAGISTVGNAATGNHSEQEAMRIIDYLTAKVPEITQFARTNPMSKLVISIEQAPEPTAMSLMDRNYHRVYVGFNIEDGGPGHRSRWATFLVNSQKTEILWQNYLTVDAYVPLADWRKYIFPSRKSDENDWMCIPFLRAGPIEPTSSLADIVRMFGRENLEQRTVYGAESSEKYETTVLYPNTVDEMIIFWRDNVYGSTPHRVSLRQDKGQWRTLYGIRPGTSIAELNHINGRPFDLFGFGWDYGGSVLNEWSEGRLVSGRGIKIVLHETRQLPREYYGDRKLRSDYPALLPNAARVRQVDLQLQ